MRTKTRVVNAHSISLRHAEVNRAAARREAGLAAVIRDPDEGVRDAAASAGHDTVGVG